MSQFVVLRTNDLAISASPNVVTHLFSFGRTVDPIFFQQAIHFSDQRICIPYRLWSFERPFQFYDLDLSFDVGYFEGYLILEGDIGNGPFALRRCCEWQSNKKQADVRVSGHSEGLITNLDIFCLIRDESGKVFKLAPNAKCRRRSGGREPYLMKTASINAGHLSQYFESVAIKRLSAVEAVKDRSNQHEFNGSAPLKRVLGTQTGEKIRFPTTFLWFGEEEEPISARGFVTWYDARKDDTKRSEYRLYFPGTDVMEKASAGDLMLIAKRTNGEVMIMIAAAGASIERQLLWLFNFPQQIAADFTSQKVEAGEDRQLGLAAQYILDTLGIVSPDTGQAELDKLLERFKGKFPTTKDFSQFTRDTLTDVDALKDPDTALISWMDYEERLFRSMERREVEQRLKTGFAGPSGMDVDGFINFSLSIQNRRKKRAGLALENHVQAILEMHGIQFDRGAETENKAKPDFLFPGEREYHDSGFDKGLLTMLGVKTSCKDRWRQVLSEAKLIGTKHLLTLEPAISVHQTAEMMGNDLQLVVPGPLHETYDADQRKWLMSFKDFIGLATKKQTSATRTKG